MTVGKKITILSEKQDALIDDEAVKKQHGKGKLGARERLGLLLDDDSFVELDPLVGTKNCPLGDGVVTGHGKIKGRIVYVFSQDFSVKGGSLGKLHGKKIAKVMEQAVLNGCPIIGINDSGGARIQEGLDSLDGYAKIFRLNTKASGVVPQISIILGPCAGGAVYSPALTDFIFTVDKLSHMFITGPQVIKKTIGEEVSFEELGGSKTHNTKSGVSHFHAEDEKTCFEMVRKLLSYLPLNNLDKPPRTKIKDSPDRKNEKVLTIIPDNPKKVYDMREIISDVMDRKSFFEVHKGYAQNVVVGFARLNNDSVGIVSTQPQVFAGCLDVNSSCKIARFVRFCDCFNIPLINFVDVPGYLPGTGEEHKGVIRHGAKILHAYSEATVPKISLVLRKAYGGAYIALCSKELPYDSVIAWPTAEIAVMGSEQAVEIINRKEIASAANPDALKEKRIEEYSEEFLNPYNAAEQGKVDMVINPLTTRSTLINVLESLKRKRSKNLPKKHGNIPL
jgi:acetyl-CoA carboxylase carboxyltransferase component